MTLNEKINLAERAHRLWKDAMLSDRPMEQVFKLHLDYIEAVQRVTFHYQSLTEKSQ